MSLMLGSLAAAGAKLGAFSLAPQAVFRSGYKKPALVDSPA